MDITPVITQDRQQIQRYGSGVFTIAGVEHHGSVIVLPEQTLTWSVTDVTKLATRDLTAVWVAQPTVELLLIGCGKSIGYLAPELRQMLRSKGISVELMDTGAACRTYNVLLAEDRRVAAALVAI